VLNKHEFRDAWAVRYNKGVVDPPRVCDGLGCGAQFSLRHALSCPLGGLPTKRHNEVTHEVAAITRMAYAAYPHVYFEPYTNKTKHTNTIFTMADDEPSIVPALPPLPVEANALNHPSVARLKHWVLR
jgi:hypothetical protein